MPIIGLFPTVAILPKEAKVSLTSSRLKKSHKNEQPNHWYSGWILFALINLIVLSESTLAALPGSASIPFYTEVAETERTMVSAAEENASLMNEFSHAARTNNGYPNSLRNNNLSLNNQRKLSLNEQIERQKRVLAVQSAEQQSEPNVTQVHSSYKAHPSLKAVNYTQDYNLDNDFPPGSKSSEAFSTGNLTTQTKTRSTHNNDNSNNSFSSNNNSPDLPEVSPELQARILDAGKALEQNKNWSDAQMFWENTVKKFPQSKLFQMRHQIARTRCDISHRLADREFNSMIQTMDISQFQQIFIEILDKLQQYYVDNLNWQDLAVRGLNGVAIALSDDNFRSTYLPGITVSDLNPIARQWFTQVKQIPIRDRNDVIFQAMSLGYLAQNQYNISATVVLFEYVCGITNSLDHYTSFLCPGQLVDLGNQIEGKFVGLGIELRNSNGILRIVRTLNGSPAQTAGLKPGDVIRSVDGVRVKDSSVDKCINLLQGIEGSVVCLEIVRDQQKPQTMYINRKRVEVASVENVHMLKNAPGVGYMKLNNFQKSTLSELDNGLNTLYSHGMRQLIIDLRGNPGGLLYSSVEVSNRFLTDGTIVSTLGKNPSEDNTYSASNGRTWRIPLTILIDRNSASAAEIFAGAMRDHNRAKIVGQQSFGKGSVQGIFPLKTCSAGLRITTAKFYSPLGHGYVGVGVKPAYEVHRTAKLAHQNISEPITAMINDLLDVDSQDSWQPIDEADDYCLQAAIHLGQDRLAAQTLKSISQLSKRTESERR